MVKNQIFSRRYRDAYPFLDFFLPKQIFILPIPIPKTPEFRPFFTSNFDSGSEKKVASDSGSDSEMKFSLPPIPDPNPANQSQSNLIFSNPDQGSAISFFLKSISIFRYSIFFQFVRYRYFDISMSKKASIYRFFDIDISIFYYHFFKFFIF